MTATEVERTINVLVVEDHAMFAEALASALGAEPGIEVTGIASSIADARAKLAPSGTPADVVLMDYRLPDGNGAQAAQEMLREHPRVRVVMVTAADDDAVLAEAIAAGCSGYVSKGESLDHLTMAVRAAAAGQMSISPSMVAGLMGRLRGEPRRSLGWDLTPRERDVLQQLANGVPNAEIAQRLSISPYTVRHHIANILEKLDAHSKLEAVTIALRERIVAPPE